MVPDASPESAVTSNVTATEPPAGTFAIDHLTMSPATDVEQVVGGVTVGHALEPLTRVVPEGTVSPMSRVPEPLPVLWAVNVYEMGVEEPAYTAAGAADFVTVKVGAFEGLPPELGGPLVLTVTFTVAPRQLFWIVPDPWSSHSRNRPGGTPFTADAERVWLSVT
jgi:hypothetical protein